MQWDGRPCGFTVHLAFKWFHHLLHLPPCGTLWGVLGENGGQRHRGLGCPLPILLNAFVTLSPETALTFSGDSRCV